MRIGVNTTKVVGGVVMLYVAKNFIEHVASDAAQRRINEIFGVEPDPEKEGAAAE